MKEELVERYLQNEMNEAERTAFEALVEKDGDLRRELDQQRSIIGLLAAAGQRRRMRDQLAAIHSDVVGDARTVQLPREENFARRHGKTIAVAASTALIAVLGTVAILSTGGYLLRRQGDQITELKRDVMELRSSSEGIVEGLTKGKKIVYAPANLEGSGFALSSNIIITSFHMVKDADSIFIQNQGTERTHAVMIHKDPKLDLAVLKLSRPLASVVPLRLSPRPLEIGDRVFTLGYPRREIVYGEGSVSSLSGFANDTSMYQISIPVNPGNSGGPLLDENGNVAGLIRAKNTGAEGTAFAVKSREVVRSISESGSDSLRLQLAAGTGKALPKGLKRSQQIRRIQPSVFNVLVYQRD